ncbi:MAG: glycosyltransferase [Opitutaceae bacterium]|nr:glycosyltransferase [Opitutaceae bacterium]
MTAPRVSICIPAYKAERFLGETLDSVRAQTFADWELIVTEDGSRDGTEAIVRAFAASVSQTVCYTRHDPNRGLPATRNAGIESARADWIALLDSDDLWTCDHLATCWETAARSGAELVHAGSMLFDSDTGKDLTRRAPQPEQVASLPLSLFCNRYCIQPASVLLHRRLWERAGRFDPAFRYVEDRDMWLRCARAGGRIAYTGLETCRYRKHGAALSTHAAPMAEATARAYDKHRDWAEIPSALRLQHCAAAWAAAGRLCWRANPAAARGHFRRACEIQWRAGWWLMGLLCAARTNSR